MVQGLNTVYACCQEEERAFVVCEYFVILIGDDKQVFPYKSLFFLFIRNNLLDLK